VLRVLANPQRCGLFLLAALLANVGTWCHNIAAVVLMYRLTRDAALVALVSVAQFSASLLLAPAAGVVADRYDRRRVLAVCQVGSLLTGAALAVLSLAGQASVLSTLVGVFVFGVCSAFHSPAQLALTPSLAAPDERAVVLALNAAQFNIARSVGPVLGSALIVAAGVGWAFAVNAVVYAWFLVTLFLVRPRPQPRLTVTPRVWQVFGVVKGNRPVVVLLIVGLVVYGAADVLVTLGPGLSVQLAGTEEWAGALVSSFGIGAAFVALVLVPILQRIRSLIAPLLLVQAIAVVVLIVPIGLWVSIVAAFVYGAAFMGAGNRALTAIQESVAPEVLGRVSAVWVMLVVGGRSVFAALEGWLVATVGLVGSGLTIAALLAAASVWFWIVRRTLPPRGRLASPASTDQ
jgi:MFS family permease